MPNHPWPPQRRLKIHLYEHGLTSTWLAETTGLSLVTTSGVISGRLRPTPRVRARIDAALGVPPGFLFENISDPTEEEQNTRRILTAASPPMPVPS